MSTKKNFYVLGLATETKIFEVLREAVDWLLENDYDSFEITDTLRDKQGKPLYSVCLIRKTLNE